MLPLALACSRTAANLVPAAHRRTQSAAPLTQRKHSYSSPSLTLKRPMELRTAAYRAAPYECPGEGRNFPACAPTDPSIASSIVGAKLSDRGARVLRVKWVELS